MIRELTNHKVNGLNNALMVEAFDRNEHGVCDRYLISCDRNCNLETGAFEPVNIQFQRGPVLENGINGVSIEALLVVVEDRLRYFQLGDYACTENANALADVQSALRHLHNRTKDRIVRGVEGTSNK